MSRPIRQSALKARERIASYYGVSVFSEKISSNMSVPTISQFIFIDTVSDLFKSFHAVPENSTKIEHKLVVANEIYTTLLCNTEFILQRDTLQKDKLRNTIIETMTRNEIELDNIMSEMLKSRLVSHSLCDSLKSSVKHVHHNKYRSSILNDISSIKNTMQQYENYIQEMNQAIREKITSLRKILNKK